jgi:hypothetical protein
MRNRNSRRAGFLSALVTLMALLAASATPAFASSAWRISSLSNPTAAPGSKLTYVVQVRNVGDKDTPEALGGDSENCTPGAPAPPADPTKCYRMIATFPPEITPIEGEGFPGSACSVDIGANSMECSATGSEPFDQIHAAGDDIRMLALTTEIAPDAAGTTPTPSFSVSGGGAGSDSTINHTFITSEAPQFGVASFDGQSTTDPSGTLFTQAAGHPYGLTTQVGFNSYDNPDVFGGPALQTLWPVEPLRHVVVDLPVGVLGNLTAAARCTTAQLTEYPGPNTITGCAATAQIGVTYVKSNAVSIVSNGPLPVYNMVPPTGAAARFGFLVAGTPVLLDAVLRRDDYGVSVIARNVSEGLPVQGSELTLWGVPSAEIHRPERACPGSEYPDFSLDTCASGDPEVPLLRLPTSCTDPGEGLEWGVAAGSWKNPAAYDANGFPELSDPNWKHSSYRTHEAPSFPAASEDWGAERGIEGCAAVPIKGKLQAQPTSIDTQTSTGLNVHVEVPNQGLENPTGIASSDIKAVKVALPEGMTVNPSQAEGLGACAPARYQSSELSFHPDGTKGCPSDSRIGTVEVHTPLLDETIPGSVYIAQPYDNPFGSLLALYVVLEEPQRGILVKLAGKVDTDPARGQITATFDGLPQLPFSSFDLKFREGSRAPLVTPQACGKYETHAEFTGWSDPAHPISSNSSFEIVRGIGGGPCPTGGMPPFKPGLIAGSINNRAGAFSPFNLRLFRIDAEQEFTNFSIKLPPGISGKLAGVPFCSDAAIAAAKNRTGADELAFPSCPAASEVGHTLAGAGVGSVLTYAPGKIYLAGPYNGSALSIAAITAAKVGPFDLGTVVVRQALKVDPETAEVFIDATGSDPIPHIIDGVTVHLRDIRAYVDKPEFTLNPTNCERTSTASTLLGSGLDFFSDVDDRPVTVSTPYQAADCAALGFKPNLKLQLKGGTKRAGHPALKATLKMKPGMANIARAQVTLPKSEFLDQSHIGTVCTRVQYAKDQCPAKSVYGYARAFTPILDEPLQGPVYLRSSSHKLPDLVAGLKSGKIEIDLAGRIDSVDGQIRSTFETVPDAPVSKFILTMQGGKKGLLENSTNLCAKAHKAIVEFDGQNGKISDSNPVVKPQCKKAKRKAAKRRNAR